MHIESNKEQKTDQE